jgi:hypothetical protein
MEESKGTRVLSSFRAGMMMESLQRVPLGRFTLLKNGIFHKKIKPKTQKKNRTYNLVGMMNDSCMMSLLLDALPMIGR